jgi:hypothetical protein
MFRSNACTLVKGYIHAGGSCDYFEPQKSKVGAGQDMGAGDDWASDPSINVQVDQPTPQDDSQPSIVDRVKAQAASAVGGVVSGAQQLATHATAPVSLPAGQTSAKQDIMNALGDDAPLPPPEPPPPAADRRSLAAPTTDTTQPVLQAPQTPPVDTSRFVGNTRLPKLPANDPIQRAASGKTVNPMDVDSSIGDAISTTVVPDDLADKGVQTPAGKITVHDVVSQALRPSALAAMPVTGAAAAVEGGGAMAAAKVLGGLGANLPEQAVFAAGEKVLGAAARPVLKVAAPAVGKAAETLAAPAVKAAADAVKPLAEQLSQSPFGKFMLEDAGAVTANAALDHARNTIKASVVGRPRHPEERPQLVGYVRQRRRQRGDDGRGDRRRLGAGLARSQVRLGQDHRQARDELLAQRAGADQERAQRGGADDAARPRRPPQRQ